MIDWEPAPQEVVVLYTEEPERLVAFLTCLGLSFIEEKHGDGPIHWAHQTGNQVLEVYRGAGRVRFPTDISGRTIGERMIAELRAKLQPQHYSPKEES